MASSLRRRGRPLGPPMLCKPIDVVPDDKQHLVSQKFDGWRARASCTDGKVTLTSREGHVIGSIPYICTALAAVVPSGTVLDGELVDLAGPRQLKRTGSILRFSRAHKPSLASPPLTYAIFDILFDGDRDLRDTPLHERLVTLERLFESDAGRRQRGPLVDGHPEPALLLVEHRPSSPQYAEALIDAGEEGVVVKHRESLYRHGARNAGWSKYKPQETVDAECIGIVPSDVAGAIAFRLDSGVEGRAGSGISALEWLDMTAHPDKYVGNVIELAHHGEERSGALRHPVYRGVRDPRDKAAPRRRARALRHVPSSTAITVAGGARQRRNYKAMGEKS